MGDRTSIEWTRGDDGSPGATWNPIVGCTKVSPGCQNCYAIGVVHRAMSPQHVGLTVKPEGERVDWTGEVRVVEHLMDQPIRQRRPRKIFVNSLSDLFHPDVDRRTIYRIVATMMCAEQHTFQVLTKRPQRMADLLSDPTFRDEVHGEAVAMWPGRPGKPAPSWWPSEKPWPLPNVWWGVSIESNRYAFRADHLRATPAAVRWVSAEPLIGALDQLDLTGIDWVVAGGESGPGSRPMHPDWARDLRDRCTAYRCSRCGASHSLPLEVTCDDHEAVRGPAFHFKQWGDWVSAEARHATHVVELTGEGHPRLGEAFDPIADRGAQLVERVGKKRAGRTLDGRTWDEYPR